MVNKIDSNKARLKRHVRVRNKVNGTAERPRLSVFRSAKNIYAQIIDDKAGVTLVSASSLEKSFTEKGSDKGRRPCNRQACCRARGGERDHRGGIRPQRLPLSWTDQRTR